MLTVPAPHTPPPTDSHRQYTEAAHALGYAVFCKPADVLLKRIRVIGPKTGYIFTVSVEVPLNRTALKSYIEGAEAALEGIGFRNFLKEGYQYRTDREDDGDRYIYDHYAITPDDEFKCINAPSTCPYLEWYEVCLHIALDYPKWHHLFITGPVRIEDMERDLFGEYRG